jgi:SAM-dependent methyltransferase
MLRTNCITCGSNSLKEIINLGMHPFADTFIPADRFDTPDKVYPLVLDLCPCGQIQTRYATSADDRYGEFDYSYTSSNSSTAMRHWDLFAKQIKDKTDCNIVLEIGSNDGYLSLQFRKLGCHAVGVDASKAMVRLAIQNGQPTTHALFGEAFAEEWVGPKPDLVVANNVLNHADSLLDFAKGIKKILSHKGTFVFELPYWVCGIIDYKFDQIYHEHVSYLTVTHAANLFSLVDMVVTDVELVDYHGGSIRVYVRHEGTPSDAIKAFIKDEAELRIHDPERYSQWMQIVKERRNRFLEIFYGSKEPVIAIGAAAKGNTFLNYYNLDSSCIECVTDASVHKIGKFTPRTRIPIKPDKEISRYGVCRALILSWNLSDNLKKMISGYNGSAKFINR